ncbi:hypothetical protein [Pedococcus sp.]|uniref:hypothetical protein n=1 Tax=Pedococcus sp. TaxID=2860345 RepID=UPI002E0F4739|nr:hypothetical protein [Pedococcus sp.]
MTDTAGEWGARLQKVADREWATARAHAALFLHGGSPPRLESHNLPLAPGELAVLRTVVTVGGPAGWGQEHAAAVIATTERLVVSHRLRGWQSVWFTDVMRFDPDLSSSQGWALTLRLHGGRGALRLWGLGVPVLAVHVGARALPGLWMDLPGLQALLDGVARDADQSGPAAVAAAWVDEAPVHSAALLEAVAAGMDQLVAGPRPDWVERLRSHPDAEALLCRPDTAGQLIDATGRLAAETLSAHWADRTSSSLRVSGEARIEMFVPQVPVVRPRVQDAARAVFNRAVTTGGHVESHPELDGLRTDELWDVWSGVLWWFEITVRRLSPRYLS